MTAFLNPIIHAADEAVNSRMEAGENPFAIYHELGADAYLSDLVASIEQPVVRGIPFPRFPPKAMQERIHGHSYEHSLREAFKYAQTCRRHAGPAGFQRTGGARLLDFGSGWGRIARMFMPEFPLGNIFGYEPNAWFSQVARDTNPYITFVQGGREPPTIFADGTFDTITAWSVFSHLPEGLAKDWLEEFARISRPGARLFLTTWGEAFLNMLVRAKADQDAGRPVQWFQEVTLKAIGDIEDARRRYRDGEFFYFGGELYGEAYVPEAAMRRILPEGLNIITVDHDSLAQTVFIIERA